MNKSDWNTQKSPQRRDLPSIHPEKFIIFLKNKATQLLLKIQVIKYILNELP